MKNFAQFFLLAVCVLFISGCLTSGLSVRENRSINYANYIYSVYDQDMPKVKEPKSLHFPLKLAVVQIGEYAPPQSLLQAIREQKTLFAQVEAIPGVFNSEPDNIKTQANNSSLDKKANERFQEIEKMCRFARDLGMDYLFIYGGSIDSNGRATPISFLDWTIVGAYLVPSYSIKAEAKACGALIDIDSSQIILGVNSESNLSTLIPTVQVEGSQERLMQRIRDDVVSKLGENFIQKVQEKHI